MIAVLAWVGCFSQPGPDPGPYQPDAALVFAPIAPTGSSTIVARGSVLYGVNAWDGTVVRTDLVTRESDGLVVGGEPTRIAVVGDELWVTLRSARAVVALVDGPSGLEEIDRIPVGAEPYGIVASRDGRVLVTLSQQDEVIEIAPGSHEVVRSWTVHDEPRWLAIHPSGHTLYVSHGFDADLTRIDLQSDEVTEHASPETRSALTDSPMAGRGTGDPTVSPDGRTLVVPVVYADHLTPGEQPALVDGEVLPPALPYYTSIVGQIGRINPALVVHPVDELGVVRDNDSEALLTTGSDLSGPVRGSLSSVTFGPDDLHVMATIGSSDAVAIVDLWAIPSWWDPALGFESRFLTFVDVAAGPSGVAITEDGSVWVQERGTRSVAELPVSDAVHGIEALMSDSYGRLDTFHATDRLAAGTSLLDPEIEAGRALFYSAVDDRMTLPGLGVSCETCHVDGRNDGLTWAFDDAPRQTPSLAGGLSDTLPVTWTDGVKTVADEALLTSVGRMGGTGLGAAESAQITAFVNQIREVDTRDVDPDLVALGAEIFARPDVGCADCHAGPRLTDNGTHQISGTDVNTPTLVGISATAPYFHDGSATTLREVLEGSRDGTMGSTGALTDDEMDALEAWLGSL